MEICDFSTVNCFYCLHLRDATEFSSLQLSIVLFFFNRRYYFDRGFVARFCWKYGAEQRNGTAWEQGRAEQIGHRRP